MFRSSASIFALHASLISTLCAASACREVKGQCSTRSDTLCLQLELSDPTTVPDNITLTLSTPSQAKNSDLTNIAATLRERPYIVEFELTAPVPDSISISAQGNSLSGMRLVEAAPFSVAPLQATRPTRVILNPAQNTNDDMSPSNDDLPKMDLAQPPDMRPAQWNRVYSSATDRLRTLGGTMSGGLTIWGVGDNGLVVRGDGQTFNQVTPPALNAQLTGLWVLNSTSAYVCDNSGRIFSTTNSGNSWTTMMTLAYPLRAIWGRGTNDIMVVGDNTANGTHYDGSSWNPAPHNLGEFTYGVWFGNTYWYIVGANGKGARATNSEMSASWSVFTPNLTPQNLRYITGPTNSDAFPLAVGDSGAVQYYHPVGQWMTVGFPIITANLNSAYVPAVNFAVVVGNNGTVYQDSGGVWSSRTNSNLTGWDLTGVWGDGSSGIWVSGIGLSSDPSGIWKF